jgi:hypothetical protein
LCLRLGLVLRANDALYEGVYPRDEAIKLRHALAQPYLSLA